LIGAVNLWSPSYAAPSATRALESTAGDVGRGRRTTTSVSARESGRGRGRALLSGVGAAAF